MNQEKKSSIVLYTQGLSFTGDTLEKQSLGGAETAFICVARELAEMGHEVTAFCPCPQPGIFDNVTYRDASEFMHWCSEEHCDLFICSRYFEIFLTTIPATIKMLWCHDSYSVEQFQQLDQVLPFINEIYCLSDFHRNYFLQHLPNREAKIKKTHNGLDFAVLNKAIDQVKKSHKIMFTSRPERGLLRALTIYEKLADPSLEFLICTYHYPWEEVKATGHVCDAKIEQLKSKGFSVTTGSFTKKELYRHLAESKAVIYPAEIAEITPISALEALACRTVYMCADHSGFQEVVPYERLNIEDTNRWLELLNEVLYNDQYRAELIEQGWQEVQSYSWTNVAKNFINNDVLQDTNIVHIANVKSIVQQYVDEVRPKISCLMPTSNRVILAKEAIRCFLDQSYHNKELVIIAGGSERSQLAIEAYVYELDTSEIVCIKLGKDRPTLGRMRNISMEAANGKFICQWDDDDLYHPERLQIQANAMFEMGASACFLTDHLQYFAGQQELYWVDWSHDGQIHGKAAQLPGSIMMINDSRFRYPEHGEGAMAGEDCAMQDAITDQLKIVNLSNHGYLYLYRFHGRNTTSEAHHRNISNYAVRDNYLLQHNPQLLESMAYFRLPKPISIKVQGGKEIISYY